MKPPALLLALALSFVCVVDPAPAAGGDDGSVLVQAAFSASAEKYRDLLRGRDPDAATPDGRTPLGIAVAQGRLDIVELLIEAGADVTARHGPSGPTALGVAISFASGQASRLRPADTRIAELILNHGGRVSYEAVPGLVLKQARGMWRPDFFARLLETATGLDDAAFEGAFTDAVGFHAEEEVAALIAHGARPTSAAMVEGLRDLRDERRRRVFAMLLAAGGQVDFSDLETLARVTREIRENRDGDLLLPVLDTGRNMDRNTLDALLAEAVLNSRTLLVHALLEKGASGDHRLREAMIVPFAVLRQSAPISAGEPVANVPLLSVALGRNAALPVVALLLEHGVDVDARDGLGRLPTAYALLRWFRRERDMGGLELLLARGATVMEMSAAEDDPVRIALRAGGVAPVRRLLEALDCVAPGMKAVLLEDAQGWPEARGFMASLREC